MKKEFYTVALLGLLFCNFVLVGMTPNAILSRSKTVYTSSGNVTYLTDNTFGGSTFGVSNNSWVAISLGAAYNQVFFSWNNPNYTWSDVIAATNSCKQTPAFPINYTIQASSNSTTGSNGTWTTLATITNNNVTARGHVVNLAGATWVKMAITSGGGQFDEIEVFDLANNGNDLWFFPGTSITANTYKATPPAGQDYADLIKQSYSKFTPAMIKGGIPCINSTDFKNDINQYIAMSAGAKYWAIEMGTNDAWGGTNGGVTTFRSNMQAVITACKNAGIQPVIARMIGTNSAAAGWQVHPDYLKAIDDVTTQNNLLAGPDLYAWFTSSSHTGELNSDGVHPNATGAASIQKLWAQKMGPLLYAVTNVPPTISIVVPKAGSTYCKGNNIVLTANATDADGSIQKVEFYEGNTLLGTATASPYTYTWTTASAAIYSLTAKATDNSGAVTISAAVASIVNATPNVTITAPATTSIQGATPVTFSASVSGDQISKVQFFNNSVLVGEDISSPYATMLTNVSSGDHTLKAVAINQNNCADTATLKIGVVTAVSDDMVSTIGVYPNPFVSDFKISVSGDFEYTVQNASGVILERGIAKDEIELGAVLAKGFYIVRIKYTDIYKVIKVEKY